MQTFKDIILIASVLKSLDYTTADWSIDAVERHDLGYTLVPLTVFQGMESLDVPINRYPGNRGVLISKNLPFFFAVLVTNGKKISKLAASSFCTP